MDLAVISHLINEGKESEALNNLNNMEQDDDNSISFFKLRGHLYSHMGMMEDYLENLFNTLKFYPDDEETVMELCEMLFDLGRKMEAEPYLKGFLEKHPDCEQAKDMLKELPSENGLPLSFSDDFLTHYLSLFSGREGVYAKQTESINGKPGYFPLYSQFDSSSLKSHLSGDITAGLYLMKKDNTVSFMVIDLDIKKKYLDKLQDKEEELKLMELLKEEVKKVSLFCNNQSIPYVLEFSGYKGYHLWFFFENPVEASLAREFGRKILLLSEMPVLEIHRELFPKQDSVSEDGLGNLVKLPLGIHKKTGKRCLILDPESFEPYGDQLAPLFSVRKISRDFMNVIISIKTDINIPENISESSDGRLQVLLEKCNVLKYLVKKARSEYYLSRKEMMVLSYILGYTGEKGIEYYHWILSYCKDYDRNIAQTFLDTLRPNPMGCSRIKYWLPGIVSKVDCNCTFDMSKGRYATPLLHTGEIPKLNSKSDMAGLIKNYVKHLSELESKKKKIFFLEEAFNRIMDEKNVNVIETSIGTLTREIHDGAARFSIVFRTYSGKNSAEPF
ncbi:MAG: CRISPR-associated primase-polymerase type A1 [Candidatus Eremiobacterota bacterium]